MIKSFLIGLLVVACGGGCSSSKLGAPKPDGSSDAGPVCPSVDTGSYCGSWADLLANPSCGAETVNANPNINSYTDCGSYHLHRVDHVDTAEIYYYDMATGDCVAAYHLGIGASVCLAGPPAGVTGPCAPYGTGPSTPNTTICPAVGGGGVGGGGGIGGGGGGGVGGG